MLRRAVDQAKLGQDEKLAALRRLDDQCRTLEAAAAGHPQRAPSLSLPAIFPLSRNAVSERFISRATACIHSVGWTAGKMQTPAGLPANGLALNESTCARKMALLFMAPASTTRGSLLHHASVEVSRYRALA